MGTLDFTGAPPGCPVTLMMPVIACAIRSNPGRAAHGPVWPKPEMLAYTRRRLILLRVA